MRKTYKQLREEARLKADAECVAKSVYTRALRGEGTTVADVMGEVLILTRCRGIVTADRKTENDLADVEHYVRTLLRRVAAEHPNIAHRIAFS